MEEEKLIIDVETEEERRIDQFLADQMEYSRSFIQKLIKNEKVTVNGNVITKVKYPVSFRDKIIIEIPAPTELEIKPEKMDLDILYEDNDVIVIDKPKGMVVHPSAGHMSHTLVNGLLYHCKEYFLAQSRYGIVCLVYILFLMLLKSFLHLERIRYIL